MLHIVELITKGKSDTGEEMLDVKKLTYEVIRTAMLLGINIINSSYHQESKENPIKVKRENNNSEGKVYPYVKEEVVELDLDPDVKEEVVELELDPDVKEEIVEVESSHSGHEYVEVKDEEESLKDEKVKLEPDESVEASEDLKTQTSSSQRKMKEKEILDILPRSKEIVHEA